MFDTSEAIAMTVPRRYSPINLLPDGRDAIEQLAVILTGHVGRRLTFNDVVVEAARVVSRTLAAEKEQVRPSDVPA